MRRTFDELRDPLVNNELIQMDALSQTVALLLVYSMPLGAVHNRWIAQEYNRELRMLETKGMLLIKSEDEVGVSSVEVTPLGAMYVETVRAVKLKKVTTIEAIVQEPTT